MKQQDFLKPVNDFVQGKITIRECLAKVSEYCDYHTDKLNEANRLVFDLTAENEQLNELHKANVATINAMDVELGEVKKFVTEISESYKKVVDEGLALTPLAEYFMGFAEKLLGRKNPMRVQITIKTAFGNPYQESVLYMADIINSVVKRFNVSGDDLVIMEKFGKTHIPYKGDLSAMASRRFCENDWVDVIELGGAV